MRITGESKQQGIPPRRWWSLAAAVVLMAVTVLVAACGDDDAGPVRSDDPPWGLTGIEMPDAEADVIAVLQALPAVDGHQPAFDMEEEFGYPSAIYYEMEEYGLRVVISAVPMMGEPPLESFDPDMDEAEGWTIEATALDPNSDLLWMAGTNEVLYGVMWADPDGSWVFAVQADTAESRVKLVHAFITAAGG
jgi:hypothetical protein